jgi:hypothetical protein
VTLTNGSAGGTLTITSVTTAGTGCGQFQVTSPPPGPLNGCDPFPLSVDYTRNAPGGPDQCTITVNYTPQGGAPTSRQFALSGSAQ